jgi:hypothetical protein
MLFPGVEGESLDQTGSDAAGAFGLTAATGGAAPAYGVLAYGSLVGAYGATTGAGNGKTYATPTSFGIEGIDGGGSAKDDYNVGIFGRSTHGTAIAGFANVASDKAGALGLLPIGVIGDGEPEAGATGYSTAIGVLADSASRPLVAVNSKTLETIDLADSNYLIANQDFYVDNSGNATAHSLTTSTGTYIRTAGASGTARMSYSAQTTAPVMEDFGEAQLVNGRGYVKLDPALSDVIDNRNAYHVFLTPEGDSKGLYVTQKSPVGFVVRESSGGRSTVAFEYRILAKPLGNDAKRLALAPALPNMHDLSAGRQTRPQSAPAQRPLDPLSRLESHVGPAEYARELKAARKIETVP